MSGSTYESDDLISSEEAPTSEKLLAAAEPVLAEHRFGELDLEDEDSMPMQQFVATDGGSVRLVIESRPDRPTVRLWWSAPVETDGADCDATLVE